MFYLLATWLICAPPQGAFDEFSDVMSPTHFVIEGNGLSLALKGELELEFHDLEGAGGPGKDSATDTRTLGTRSPFVEIDSFWLAPRLRLGEATRVDSILEFWQAGARVGAAYFNYCSVGTLLTHYAEAGYQTPFIKLDRRTERYPLIATAFWREPEMHVAYEAALGGNELSVSAGVSLGLQRPLTFAGVQDSISQRGTLNIISYGPGRAYSGSSPSLGGKLLLRAHGAFVQAFGYVSRLALEGGTDVLRGGLANYVELPGYMQSQLSSRAMWGGGRLGFDAHDIHAWVEAIASQEALLLRYGAYAQASQVFRVSRWGAYFNALEPLVRYEIYRIRGAKKVRHSGRALRSVALGQAATWDWNILTLALIAQVYRDLIRARVEYAIIDEDNGVPALGQAEVPFRNNELMVQLELRF